VSQSFDAVINFEDQGNTVPQYCLLRSQKLSEWQLDIHRQQKQSRSIDIVYKSCMPTPGSVWLHTSDVTISHVLKFCLMCLCSMCAVRTSRPSTSCHFVRLPSALRKKLVCHHHTKVLMPAL
jgi:hypothetical protein